MSRRRFLQTLACVGAAPFVLGRSFATPQENAVIKPQRLRRGDLVGVVAPASTTFEKERIRMAIDVLETLGLRVKQGKHLFERKGYLAGEDRNRAADVNAMFADSDVCAVFCLRGGYGAPRMLPYLDYELIAQNPKIIIGYSDITVLLHAIHLKTGLATFHGPMPTSDYSPYALEALKRLLFEPVAPTAIAAPPPFEAREGAVDRDNRLVTVVPGKAEGRLMGGNLSLMVTLLGTPFEPDFKDRILILEDINEQPYRVDRMLTHLWLSGKLEQLAGVVIGKCTDCDPQGTNSLSLETIYEERFGELKLPTLRGLMIGHVEDNHAFPIGCRAKLDAEAQTLTLLETAVR